MKPKQLTDLEIAIKMEEIEREEYQQELHICKYCGAETTQPDDECSMLRLKQETLEDLLNKKAEQSSRVDLDDYAITSNSVEWQAERTYSEEDVYHILCEHTAFLFMGGKSTLTEWFEKYKKK